MMNKIEEIGVRIGVMLGIILLPTILGGIPLIIYHGNFAHINPYEWEEVYRALWTVSTTAMVLCGPIIAFMGLTVDRKEEVKWVDK